MDLCHIPGLRTLGTKLSRRTPCRCGDLHTPKGSQATEEARNMRVGNSHWQVSIYKRLHRLHMGESSICQEAERERPLLRKSISKIVGVLDPLVKIKIILK